MKERAAALAGFVVGAGAKNLRYEVRGAKNLGAIPQDFRAFGDVIGVWITGFGTCARFNDYFESCFGEIGNYGGDQREPHPPRKSFAGHTDNHEASSDTQELNLILIRILAGPHCT